MRYYIIIVLIIMASASNAQTINISDDNNYYEHKFLLPEPTGLYSYSSLTIREKFLRLNDKDKDENNPGSITPAKTQDDNKKIGNEIYYFIGAGVIAAIIYFLVPDKEPASKTNYTFGLPVTPK